MPWPQYSRTTENPALFRMLLDGMADVAQVGARAHQLDGVPHGLAAGFGQPLRLHRGLADVVHAAGVAVIAILDDGDVDIEDVAGLEHPVVRNAVANHVVRRGADGLGEAPVADVGRYRLLGLDDEVVADPVQFRRW